MKPAKRFHFDLSHLIDDSPKLTFHVGRNRHSVQPHTETTRAAATRENRALALIPPTHHHRITHYVDVNHEHLPTDRLCLMRVTYDHGNEELHLPALVHASYHIPEKYRSTHRRDRHAKGRPHVPHKLSAYGVDVQALAGPQAASALNQTKKPIMLKSAAPIVRAAVANADNRADSDASDDSSDNTAHEVTLISDHADQFATPLDAAGFILFHHPHLASANPHTAARIYDDHINSPENMLALNNLTTAIAEAQDNGGWATIAPDTMPDGTPCTYEYQFGSHNPGDPVLHYELAPEVRDALPAALNTPLKSSSDDPGLQNKSWSVTQGATAVHTRGRTPGQPPLMKAGIGKANWTLSQKNPGHGLSVDESSISFEANPQNDGSGTFSIDATNSFLRCLGAYVEFYDEAGNAIDEPAGWESRLPSGLGGLETSSKKYIGTMTAVCTIMGIPLPADSVTLSFPWPSNAASARLLFAGLGGDMERDGIWVPGAVLTCIFQYGIPMFMLATSVGLRRTKWYQEFMADPNNVVAVLGIATTATIITASKTHPKQVVAAYANLVGGILVKAALKPVFEQLVAMVAEEEVEDQTPFVGWCLLAVDLGITGAQLAETTMEVASSPSVLRYDVQRAFDLKVKISPDPAHGMPGKPETAVWPAVSDNYEVTVQYQGGTNFVKTGDMPRTTSNKPIESTFSNIAVGGKIQIIAAVYSESGWLCGKWTSDWMDAVPGDGSSTLTVPPATITEQLVPLTTDSQYTHKEKIVYDAGQSKHIWQVGTPSIKTNRDVKSGNVGPALSRLVNMTIFERTFEIGYAWQAASQGLPLAGADTKIETGQAYAFRNLSVLADPESQLKFPNRSFEDPTYIVYDQFGEPTDAGSGSKPHQFFLDPRNGHFHLRQLTLDDGNTVVDLTQPLQSWGQFTLPHVDALVVHSGKVIAASWEAHKLAILNLPDSPSADANAVQALNVSGEGTRQGLVRGPAAMTVVPEGRLLVLESTNRRVQAFDLSANPVPSFDGAKLFSVSASDFAPDLDLRVFSPALQAQFMTDGINHLFDLDTALVSELNQPNASKKLCDAFSLKGLDLDYDDTDPTLHTTIKAIAQGQQWQLDCAATKRQYLIFAAHNGPLGVYVILNNVVVEVRSPGKRWIVKDKNGSVSYDVKASQDQTGKLDVFEFLSYLPLHNPTPGSQVTYLDLASEARGYVYVLSYTGSGSETTDYFLDIYEPNGAFLCRTPDSRYSTNLENVAAAKLAVDTWRNAFTLNFDAQPGPNGSTEPTIGHWMPMPPLFSLELITQPSFDQTDAGAVRTIFGGQHKPITLGDGATVTIISTAGHWKVTDGSDVYDVIRSGDKLDVYKLAPGARI